MFHKWMGINTFNIHGCAALAQMLSQFTIQTSSPCRQHAWPENMHRNWLNFFVFIDFRKILLEDTLSPASQPSSGKRTCPRSPAAWSSWAACRRPQPPSSSGCWTWEASQIFFSFKLVWNEYVSFGLLSVFEVHCTCENIHIQRHNFLLNYLKALTHICNFHALQCMQWSGCHCRQLSCSGWIIVQVQVFD